MYITPKRIRSGSRVAIVAPASTFSTEELHAGLDIIRESGLEPVIGPCVKNLNTSIYRSAPVQERVQELSWAFSSPDIAAVIAVRGGEGSAAVLPFLDYDLIRKSRKPFLGKSDITAISMGILAKSGLININGRGASIKIGDYRKNFFDMNCQALRDTLTLLMSDQSWGSKPFLKNQHFPRTVSSGMAHGKAVGGNCDTFSHLLGTDFLPDLSGAILFLEDVNKSPVELSRLFLHMKLAGVLRSVSGVVLGEFVDTNPKKRFKEEIEDVILEYFSVGPPCMYGVSFSHGSYTCPIPMGADCTMDADTGSILFDFMMFPAVR